MNKPVLEPTLLENYALDVMLIGVAVELEPSVHDEKIANKRYQLLEKVLKRPRCLLKKWLQDQTSSIYAQGSFASGTLIISGEKDDRFDVDAIIQFSPGGNYTPKTILDALFHDLQGFPGAIEIERCTRCIQVRFPQMHLDVTPLIPPSIKDTPSHGEICHSPDEGDSSYVPAHPKGAADWYRERMNQGSLEFYSAELEHARSKYSVNRLHDLSNEEYASVEPLPETTSTRTDDLRAIAVKLLKRNLRRKYNEISQKRPPSIYLTILSGQLPSTNIGLTDELVRLALHVKNDVKNRLAFDLANPVYEPDIITDRWPSIPQDISTLTHFLDDLVEKLQHLKSANLSTIQKTLAELFGEHIATSVVKRNVERIANASSVGVSQDGKLFDTTTVPKPVLSSPYIKPKRNTFHASIL